MIQGSPEWKAARVGKLTSSRIADAVRRTQKGWAATRRDVLADVVVERLTGNPVEHFETGPMRWGREQEPVARAAYEFMHGVDVELVGFVAGNGPHDGFGASPDGLVGTNGLVEFKCPTSSTHLATLQGMPIDPDYVKQMQWQMLITGRDWCDYVSFDPRFPDHLQLRSIRVDRDAALIEALAGDGLEFMHHVESAIKALG